MYGLHRARMRRRVHRARVTSLHGPPAANVALRSDPRDFFLEFFLRHGGELLPAR
jgi:hypothetical protein